MTTKVNQSQTQFGQGIPVAIGVQGTRYFDTSSQPYIEYIFDAGVWVRLGGGGGSVTLLTATVNLTAAQINHLFSSPVDILPAPGVGRFIDVIAAVFSHRLGTVPFGHSGNPLFLTYQNATNPSIANDNSVFFAGVSSTSAENGAIATANTVLENQPLVLTNLVDDDVNYGAILTSSVTGGNAGLLYAPGDTGTISIGFSTTPAHYVIDTVGAGGAVTGFHLTFDGAGFNVGNGVGTNVVTGAGDGNFQVNVNSITPGDGSGSVTVLYFIETLP